MLKDYTVSAIPKIVITTVPFVDENTPLAAPAVLKASLQANGINCVALDLNIEIYNKIQHHPNRHLFLDFFYHQHINEEIVDELTRMLEFYAQKLLAYQPTIIGLSVFSLNSQTFTAWLCAVLRQKCPTVKIVIGGPGLSTLSTNLFKYPDRLRQLGLIDAYITGDAERSLVEYIQGNLSYPGINSTNWLPNPDFVRSPIPDYSDYNFFHYEYELIPIIDSRGCVQDCEFCDVIAFWKKFQYLPADLIFSQMLAHIEKYNVYRFQFSSSICNGNLKEFKKLVELIANYNDQQKNSTQHIHWVGSFIVRSASAHKEDLWKLIKKSNGYLLTGVESVVEHIRINLGKNFTNNDLEHHITMAHKYQVPMNLLMIAAYPTETAEDYEQVKQWFIDHKQFANNSIMQIQVTLPGLLPGTELFENTDHVTFQQGTSNRRAHGNTLINIIKECGFNIKSFL